MITISIISVFPDLHKSFINHSIIGKAQEKGLTQFNLVAFSDFCAPKERIDTPIAGPGSGMIIKPTVVAQAIESCIASYGRGYTIFFSPQGEKLNQKSLAEIAHSLAPENSIAKKIPAFPEVSAHLILVCARYEGIDSRVEEHYADKLISIGDFVVMGGDTPAQLFLEGLLRLFPGIVGKQESVQEDSYQGAFFDYPSYGLPTEWNNKKIPNIVQSGNHEAIRLWRQEQAAEKTILTNFSWFNSSSPTKDEISLARKFIPNHYVAIMHTDVMLKDGRVGQTSIPSLDIHDIARSCTTYGVKNFFIVSPLNDQQHIVETFITFWQSDEGRRYNKSRYEALKCIEPVYEFDEMIASIEKKEAQRPLIIGTSAQYSPHAPIINYRQQSKLWREKRPILLVFGTGQGLADCIIKQCNYMLTSVNGLTNYNHLSVRSAVSIILDRWLGLHPDRLDPDK